MLKQKFKKEEWLEVQFEVTKYLCIHVELKHWTATNNV